MTVVSMVTSPPTYQTRFVVRYLIRLTLQTGFVYTVLANGTVFDRHVPTPKGNRVPLLDLDALVDLHL